MSGLRLRFVIGLLLVSSSALFAADNQGEPLKAILSVVPAVGKPEDTIELQLTLTISAPWHAYASAGFAGQVPIKIDMKFPDGVEPAGEWIWPPSTPIFDSDEVHIYRAGTHVFRRKVKLTTPGDPIDLRVTVTYQCCTPEFCRPPEVTEVGVTLPKG